MEHGKKKTNNNKSEEQDNDTYLTLPYLYPPLRNNLDVKALLFSDIWLHGFGC